MRVTRAVYDWQGLPPGCPQPQAGELQAGRLVVLRFTPAGSGQGSGTSPPALRGPAQRDSGPHFAISAITPLHAPSPKAAMVGGESGRDTPCLSFPLWWHLGAGFEAEGSSPFFAQHSLFVSLAKVKPLSMWDAVLNVRKYCGGRGAREVPQHGDTVKEGSCAAVTLPTGTQRLLANALPARETEASRLTASEG